MVQGKRIKDVVNRMHVAQPQARDGVSRPPVIPPGVAQARAARDGGYKPPTEKDLQVGQQPCFAVYVSCQHTPCRMGCACLFGVLPKVCHPGLCRLSCLSRHMQPFVLKTQHLPNAGSCDLALSGWFETC